MKFTLVKRAMRVYLEMFQVYTRIKHGLTDLIFKSFDFLIHNFWNYLKIYIYIKKLILLAMSHQIKKQKNQFTSNKS